MINVKETGFIPGLIKIIIQANGKKTKSKEMGF